MVVVTQQHWQHVVVGWQGVNDRSAGSRLESRWEQTQKTWQAEFGEARLVCGKSVGPARM